MRKWSVRASRASTGSSWRLGVERCGKDLRQQAFVEPVEVMSARLAPSLKGSTWGKAGRVTTHRTHHAPSPRWCEPLRRKNVGRSGGLIGGSTDDGLKYSNVFREKWCRQRDLNPRPRDYKSRALPSELCRHFPPGHTITCRKRSHRVDRPALPPARRRHKSQGRHAGLPIAGHRIRRLGGASGFGNRSQPWSCDQPAVFISGELSGTNTVALPRPARLD